MTTSLDRQVHAIRHSAAVSSADHICCLRIVGRDSFEVVDAVCSSDLYLRDGQMLHTLVLDGDARPFADAYVCRDDEDFLLLAEGPTPEELRSHIEQAAPHGASFEIHDVGATHSIVSVDGPYAWELLGEVLGPDIISLPYRTFFHVGEGLCLRAGKTGEFGYLLILPREEASMTVDRLLELGQRYDALRVGIDALDQCALDNWFFCVRHALPPDITPIELQLQWRVSYRKEYVGSAALSRRRERGAAARTTMLASAGPIAVGDRVFFGEGEIGRVYAAALSPIRGDWVGAALLERPYAHSGVRAYSLMHESSRSPIRTLSPPLINNRSLYVDPRKHTYHHREDEKMPELVPASQRCV